MSMMNTCAKFYKDSPSGKKVQSDIRKPSYLQIVVPRNLRPQILAAYRGVGIGGSGGSDEPPHGPEKVRKNRGFFFLSGIAQESVIVEKDERTPPIENKSCKTRHDQVGTSPKRRRVAAKENQ